MSPGSKSRFAIPLLIFAVGVLPLCWYLSGLIKTHPSSSQVLSEAGSTEPVSVKPLSSKERFPSSLQELSEQSANIADRVKPSVVKIYVSRGAKERNDKEIEGFFGQLPVEKDSDIGSGFFIRSDGWVLTDFHVVKNADTIRIEDILGQSWNPKLHGYDAVSDLAVLKVETENHPHLEWGESKKLRAGHFVWIVGSPFGLESSLSFGVISSTGRNVMNGSALRDYLQTDAAINPGSSGGPMVDIDGKVVGIASAILGEEYRGIGFVLPEQIANPTSKQLIETGKATRGWIGVQLGQVTLERARKAGLERPSGAYIEWLESGDIDKIPAKKAGLVSGDICMGCNGNTIQSHYDLARQIAFTIPGESLKLDVQRESKSLVVVVQVSAKP